MSFLPSESFRPAVGLEHPHAQTLYAHLARSSRRPRLTRERFETPDGDFVDVDVRRPALKGAPWVLVLHGLEGSSRAGYVAAILRGAAERGWGAAALNFRGCSGEENRLPRFYHSGDTGDATYVLGRLRDRISGPIFAVGFSLGGNVLLRLLAETGASAPVDAAVAISVPYDLGECARALDSSRGLGSVYRLRFLQALKVKALRKWRRHRSAFDAMKILLARGIHGYDDVVTSVLHGYANAAEYYDRCSSAPVVGQIRRPTLLISAADDPLVPTPVPKAAYQNRALSVVVTSHGGHVGFVAGSALRPRYWAEEQAMRYLDQCSREVLSLEPRQGTP